MKKIIFLLLAIVMMAMAVGEAKAQGCPPGYSSATCTYLYSTNPVCFIKIYYCYYCSAMGPTYFTNLHYEFDLACFGQITFDQAFYDQMYQAVIWDCNGVQFCGPVIPCPYALPNCIFVTSSCYKLTHKAGIPTYEMFDCSYDAQCEYAHAPILAI